MEKIEVQFYNFRIDDGFQKLDSVNPYDLEKEFNLKTIIFDVKENFNLEYIDSEKLIFIFFSHSIYDVSKTLNKFEYFKTINQNLSNRNSQKVVFFCEDMDWCRNSELQIEVESNFEQFFGANLSFIEFALANKNWSFNWNKLNVKYNLGCLSYILQKNINESSKYSFDNLEREYKLFTVNNEPRGVRLYFYKHLIDNNLLSNFDYSFFFKYQHKDFLTWENKECDDSLPPIDGIFPVKTFDNENNDDYYKKIKLINFNKVSNSYVDVVIETSVIDKNFFAFSEKSFKPIISKKPFIIFGSKDCYKGLKEFGFETFDDLIDIEKLNSFEEWEFKQRVEFYCNEIGELSKKPIEFFKEYYIKNKDKIEYNHSHLKDILKNEYSNFYNLLKLK